MDGPKFSSKFSYYQVHILFISIFSARMRDVCRFRVTAVLTDM
eukprot:SAG31_NODE_3159_length_4609_cov_3.554324_1_plen_43_part_00